MSETRDRCGLEHLRPSYEQACVSIAADGRLWRLGETPPRRLEPHLWEALRVEMQRRWREATGEEHATLSVGDPTHD
jgi:hypothetical protein